MTNISYPYILTPSIGNPQFVSIHEDTLEVIVAAKDSHIEGNWKLVSSNSQLNFQQEIDLVVVQEKTIELSNIDYCHPYQNLHEKQCRFSRELLSRILDSSVQIYNITLNFKPTLKQDAVNLLRQLNGKHLPTLYNLLLKNQTEQIKYHSICFRDNKDDDLRVMHLTDLHLARRNDLIEQEISTKIGRLEAFNNFNKNLRNMIIDINQRIDNAALDFVIISGDLVDYVYHGIRQIPHTDTNWKLFIEIMTGMGMEKSQNNTGIRAPIFTSIGNHDRRLFPYNVKYQSFAFGISKADAENFDFKYFNDTESYLHKVEDSYQKLMRGGRTILSDNVYFTLAKMFPIGFLAKMLTFITPMFSLLKLIIRNLIKRLVEYGVIPIEARTTALHEYFLSINPYFNFVFSYAGHYFIFLDTGPDCLTAQSLWDAGDEKLHRVDLRELIGGSPDSMAFYPANENYDIGQITWLENIIALIAENKADCNRIIIVVHAPPINTESDVQDTQIELEQLLEKGKVNTRFGTINHFLSQFYHLCRGERENCADYSGPCVDMILSGHTHYAREYRIDKDNKIYSGKYSNFAHGVKFEQYKPIVLQTAACGPFEKSFINSPYYRLIHINKIGEILDYKQYSHLSKSTSSKGIQN